MAKTIVYKVKIEGYEELLKKIGKLEKAYEIILKKQKKNIKSNDELKEANKKLADSYKKLINKTDDLIDSNDKTKKSFKGLIERSNALDLAIEGNRDEFKKLSKSLNKVNKSFSTTAKAAKKLGDKNFELKGSFEQVKESGDDTGDLFQGLFPDVFSTVAGSIEMAISAGAALVEAGAAAVESARKQEEAEKGLTAVLREGSEALFDQAYALQQKTAFSDLEIIASQQILAEYGLQKDQIEQMTPAILDFAAAQGITATEAASVFADNMAGTSTSLNEFGIDLKGAKDDSNKLGVAMDGLKGKFGGMAEQAGNTGSGAIDKLKNSFEEAKNQLGNGLIQVLGKLAPIIQPIVVQVTEFIKKLVDGMTQSQGFSTAIDSVKTVFELLWQPIQRAIDILAIIYENLFVPIAKFVMEHLVPVFVALQKAFSGQGDETKKLFNPLQALGNLIGKVLNVYLDAMGKMIQGIVIPAIQKMGEIINAVADPLSDFASGVADFLGLSDDVGDGADNVNNSVNKLTDTVNTNTDTVSTNTEVVEENTEVTDNATDANDKYNISLGDTEANLTNVNTATNDYTDGMKKQNEAVDDAIKKQNELNAARAAQAAAEQSNDDGTNAKENDEQASGGDNADPEASSEKSAETIAEERQKVLEANMAQANEILEFTKGALDQLDQINQKKLESDLAKIDERRNAEIEAVENSTLSEEEKQAKIASINDKYDKQADEKRKASAKREKAIAITTALINGALAVTQAIAQFGPPPSPAGIAGIAAAALTTAIQVASITKQKYAEGGVIPFAEGGMITGALHNNGGVPFSVGGQMMEAEGGELIVNRNIWSRPDLVRSISEMNAMTGGKRFFAAGGVVPQAGVTAKSTADIDMRSEVMTQELINGLRGVIADEVGSLRVVNNVVDTTDQQVTVINQQTESSF